MRQQDLRADQVHAIHLFGDGVLHLNARVGLHKKEGVALRGNEKLEGAERPVAQLPRHEERRFTQPLAQFVSEEGGWREFDDLLVTPLDGTIAVAHVPNAAAAVAGHLHLDMAHVQHALLDINIGDAEGALRLRATALPCPRHVVARRHRPHAAPATAGQGLDHHLAAGAEFVKEGCCCL